jgi:hypothetical protein
MRVSPGGLLVAVTVLVPILIEARWVLASLGVDLSSLEAIALGALVVSAVVVWAVLPESDPETDGRERPDGGRS